MAHYESRVDTAQAKRTVQTYLSKLEQYSHISRGWPDNSRKHCGSLRWHHEVLAKMRSQSTLLALEDVYQHFIDGGLR